MISKKNDFNKVYKKNKKGKFAKSIIFVILIAEMIGLFGIFILKYFFDLYSVQYTGYLSDAFREKNHALILEDQLYNAETTMHGLFHEEITIEEFEQKLGQIQGEMDACLEEYETIMSKDLNASSSVAKLQSVKNNMMSFQKELQIMMDYCKAESLEKGHKYYREQLHDRMTTMHELLQKLNSDADGEIRSVGANIAKGIENNRIVSFICILSMVAAIVFSIAYSAKVLSVLETDRKFFQFESNVQKNKLEESQQKIGEMQNSIVIGIADLIENRSSETGMHVKRTSQYAQMIAQRALEKGYWPKEINEQFVTWIAKAAPLHDVGKIMISDSILNKPGKLTDEEFKEMKTHAIKGGKIVLQLLDGIEDERYIEMAYDIACYHHEKWNGKGYPAGIKEEKIPLSARIMAVADVFDALISERCYKRGMSFEKAFEIIESEAGEHFDPDIVGIFVELRDEIINLKYE